MNKHSIFILKALRRVLAKQGETREGYDRGITNADEASDTIRALLEAGKPCMVARFGAFELATLVNYLGVIAPQHSVWRYVRGEQPEWWWTESLVRHMQTNAGFFPSTPENLLRFGEEMMHCIPQVDVLGSWLPDERRFFHLMSPDLQRVSLLNIEPYWAKHPWSAALKGKRVLVVHPFAELIERQYAEKRTLLFENPEVLPPFELRTLQAVQSIGGESNNFTDWFEALQWMKDKMDAQPYDVCLIGCGAYGFPLAAHAKRTGHQAIHLGGALQLLFGIKGKRWEDPNYGVREIKKQGQYSTLFNEHWIRPSAQFIPTQAKNVEEGCYW